MDLFFAELIWIVFHVPLLFIFNFLSSFDTLLLSSMSLERVSSQYPVDFVLLLKGLKSVIPIAYI